MMKCTCWTVKGFSLKSRSLLLSSQDVCIPDLIKLLDILGDNGVRHWPITTCYVIITYQNTVNLRVTMCFLLLSELKERGAGGHYSSQYCPVSRWEGLSWHISMSIKVFDHEQTSDVCHCVFVQWIQQIEGTEAALHQKMMDLELEMVSSHTHTHVQ